VSEPSLSQQPGADTWLLSGVVVTGTVSALVPLGRRCIDDTTGPEVTFNLSDVTESDSAAVALLIDWFRYAKQHNKQLVLEKMPDKMRDVIKVDGLEKILFER
jgi:anti-anti-sigma factor